MTDCEQLLWLVAMRHKGYWMLGYSCLDAAPDSVLAAVAANTYLFLIKMNTSDQSQMLPLTKKNRNPCTSSTLHKSPHKASMLMQPFQYSPSADTPHLCLFTSASFQHPCHSANLCQRFSQPRLLSVETCKLSLSTNQAVHRSC